MPQDRRDDRHRARRHAKWVRTCAACGDLILRDGPGRPPVYCSARCRVAAWRQRQTRPLPDVPPDTYDAEGR